MQIYPSPIIPYFPYPNPIPPSSATPSFPLRTGETKRYCSNIQQDSLFPAEMAIFSHSNSNFILSIKVVVISAAVFSMAVMLKLSVPIVTDFARSEVPSIWSLVASWLRPPYLYLVINCIIITIVASSKLQSKSEFHDHHCSFSPPALETLLPVHPHPIKINLPDTRTEAYGGGEVLKSEVTPPSPEFEYGYDPKIVKVSDFGGYVNVGGRISATKTTFTVNASEGMPLDARVSETKIEPTVNALEATDDFVISKSSCMELSKPPVSSRFSHRKVVRTSPEGGKTTLRSVSKPKRHDTLESTWKTITDGRPVPLTRHLRKSDTWETRGGNLQDHNNNNKMTKSETFNDRSCRINLSSGSGKLRKDPSDELNKRVEAFINKFNEDMRLQRQESLNQYMEMINRGAH